MQPSTPPPSRTAGQPNGADVDLLWTGGWDSTFRLLQLLFRTDTVVQPYYLIDADRLSTGRELRTMRDIRAAIAAHRPDLAARLRPARFCDVADVPPDPAISDAFLRIRARTRIGGQYNWLARFCAHRDLNAMEVGIHRDDRAHAVLAGAVRDGRVADAARDSDEWQVFRFFRFPLFDVAKTAMAEQARTHGWDAYMDLTWFCHRPRRNGTPCGSCLPCRFTVAEGLGHRLPPVPRLRARLTALFHHPR